MRIKVEGAKEGLHPDETFAIINTINGPQELIVDADTTRVGYIDVGSPVGRHDRYYLVELPSETSSGAWRVWVDQDVVLDETREAAE